MTKVGKDNSANVPTSSDKPTEEAEHPGVTEKVKNANQEWPLMLPTITQDPPVEKEAPKKMEIVLTTLSLPAKVDPTSKFLEALEAASTQPIHDPPKDKIVIKKK